LPGPLPIPDTDEASLLEGNSLLDEVEVLGEVAAMLAEVIGEDDLVGIDIGLDTSFQEDLELESIEFVALSERLMDRYGKAVDFVGWMASMELDEIIALTLGDLVRFVASPT
jgi:acyl carrier protein